MNQIRRFPHPDFNRAQAHAVETSQCTRDADGWERPTMCASEYWRAVCSNTEPGEERFADRASIAVTVYFGQDSYGYVSEGYIFAQRAAWVTG